MLLAILKTNKGDLQVHQSEYPFKKVSIKYPMGQWSPSMETNKSFCCDIVSDAAWYVNKYFGYEVLSIKYNVNI
jgi:hypothetical protein